MNPAAQLLAELTTRGVVVAPAGASLHLYPRSALSPDLLARVRALKPQLLQLLRAGAMATPAEWTILTALALHPGLTLDNLAATTRLPRRPLAQALRTLIRRAEITPGTTGKLYLNTL
jgi:hypothetical protein